MIKNILISGATGFIGSHVTEEALKKDFNIIALKRSDFDIWRIKDFVDRVKLYDIDKISLEQIFNENKIDCVIHLGSKYIKNHTTLGETEEMINFNVGFSSKLCEICVETGVKYFVNTGSFFEYKQKDEPLVEKDKIAPYNFYSATKAAFSDILKYYTSVYDFRVIDLKLFANFGEMDNEKMILFLIKSLINSAKEIKFSGGEQKWNFTYVKDTAKAFICAVEKIEQSDNNYEVVNVGYDKVYSIREIVKILEEISGKKLDIEWGAAPYVKNEIFYSNCDNKKAKEFLGWAPDYDFIQGIKNTYNYYLKAIGN